LVINPIVDGAFLPKTLIDGGSSLNIIFTETLRRMDFDFKKMIASDEAFYVLVPDKAVYPIGRVYLPVTFGTKNNIRTEYLTFEVVDIRSSYHVILGRPMLAKDVGTKWNPFRPRRHYCLLQLREVHRRTRRRLCLQGCSKGHMVANAAKMDQTTLEVP
jgi:hypothetical protein